MTKKDYILIAKQLKDALYVLSLPPDEALSKEKKHDKALMIGTFWGIVNDLSQALKKDNPNFNADRFAVACGLSQSQEIGCEYCTNYPCSEHARE